MCSKLVGQFHSFFFYLYELLDQIDQNILINLINFSSINDITLLGNISGELINYLETLYTSLSYK